MKPELQSAFDKFRINTCSPLNGTGLDAANEILPMIHGLATLMQQGCRKYEGEASAFEEANTELIASAFDGISYLAALALFRLDNE